MCGFRSYSSACIKRVKVSNGLDPSASMLTICDCLEIRGWIRCSHKPPFLTKAYSANPQWRIHES